MTEVLPNGAESHQLQDRSLKENNFTFLEQIQNYSEVNFFVFHQSLTEGHRSYLSINSSNFV